MSALGFGTLPGWAPTASAVAHLAGGIALGLLYFGNVWRGARRFRNGSALHIVGAMALRFVLLGGVLTLVAHEGAMPLLLTALGIFVGRAVVLRRVRSVAR